MLRKIIAVSVLILATGAFAAAQTKLEFRKTGETQTLYAGGQAIGALVPFKEADFVSVDDVREVRPGMFEWTRTVTYNGMDYVRPVRLRMEFEALYKSVYSMIPAVMYDGNPWGTGQEPKGFMKDGKPWTFAYKNQSALCRPFTKNQVGPPRMESAPVAAGKCSVYIRESASIIFLNWGRR